VPALSSKAVIVRTLLRRRGTGDGVATGAEEGLDEDGVYDEADGFRFGAGEENEDWYDPNETSGGSEFLDASPEVSLSLPARPRTDMIWIVLGCAKWLWWASTVITVTACQVT
jgi:hypothetical protein